MDVNFIRLPFSVEVDAFVLYFHSCDNSMNYSNGIAQDSCAGRARSKDSAQQDGRNRNNLSSSSVAR